MTIRKSIRVERPPEVSFKAFCEEIGQWWPKGPSFGGKHLTDMFIEGRVDGRFYERHADGTEYEIRRVTVYQPPAVVAFTWRAPMSWEVATRVEVRFIAEGTGTRVELEHTGWEQTAKILEFRKNYDSGWDMVLGHYQSHTVSLFSVIPSEAEESQRCDAAQAFAAIPVRGRFREHR
jgi:Activator of Hsp90 ATPase homolog 1-like protein